jgi:hypothetical protein
MQNVKIISYPRTGANFLSQAIEQQVGISIPVTHFLEEPVEVILNILRKPEDSIASMITMGILANKYTNNRKYYYSNINKNNIDQEIYHLIKYYLTMYNFLLRKNTIFINYNDFNNINTLLSKLYEKINIEAYNIKPIDNFELKKKLQLGKDYLITSKESGQYEIVLEILSKHNFDQCNKLYYDLLQKSMTI